MTQRALHVREVEALETSTADRCCYVSCKSVSGLDIDLRLPLSEAKKLYELLQRRFADAAYGAPTLSDSSSAG